MLIVYTAGCNMEIAPVEQQRKPAGMKDGGFMKEYGIRIFVSLFNRRV